MSSELKTNKISPATGTALTLADSGDTLTLPSGATLDIASGATIDATGATITGWPAAVDMTPSFGATADTNQSVSSSTHTEMIFDSEDWDTDSAYDPSTGRFTVPSGEGGKYFFTATLGVATASGATGHAVNARMAFRKNGNELGGGHSASPTTNQDVYLTHTLVTTLSAGDYISVYLYQTLRSPAVTGAGSMSFAGWKLIL